VRDAMVDGTGVGEAWGIRDRVASGATLVSEMIDEILARLVAI